MAGNICDVCGKGDIGIAGVFASTLGPMSFAYCPICLVVGAEPKFMLEATIESCSGMENIHPDLLLTYYDNETDFYLDKRKGTVPIELKNGTVFKTRSEMVEYIREKQRKDGGNVL